MKTTLIYSTPQYHKLVEYAARNCYDSFNKCDTDSHKLVRGIMKKGHLSIAGHGNIVFVLSDVTPDQELELLDSLVTFKELNNYIRWTREGRHVVSMSILTYLDIVNGVSLKGEEGNHFNRAKESRIFRDMVQAVLEVPALRWFADSTYLIEGSENPYLTAQSDLLKPAILSSDYVALKELGLTDYELDIHSTITVEIVSDRAMSLQDARHTDMMGRSEISQRYVSMSDFKYRVPVGLEKTDVIYTEANGLIEVTYADIMGTIADSYDKIMEYAKGLGHNQLRAKELARSILPNAIYSKYIDTRPLKQWKHFFKLRVDNHAQNEKQQDAKALLEAFASVGIKI